HLPGHPRRLMLALLWLFASPSLLFHFECDRCHETSQFPIQRHCVLCHQMILDGSFDAPPEDLARWQPHIVSLRVVPSLEGLKRLRGAWVRAFLLSPRDLRPNLRATMPRLPLTPADADAIARWLVPVEVEAPLDGDLERGRRLYAELRCAACH